MILGTVPDHHQYHACCRCGEPNSGTLLLFHYWYSFHEAHRLCNYHACPDCAELFRKERGRGLTVRNAPKLMGPPNPDAPPIRDADYWKHGFADWLDAHEYERYQDDLEWDAQRHG